MGLASPEHGEMVESAWKHDERLNNYKMATHTKEEDVCVQARVIIESGM